ncbi:hypothetical protein CDAR_616241 [Caerostris darwini]|uniref:Uncharacterized protein n=1 Tax=Caerostris darwini TaxID=1538125 RepID=A0AAV4PRM3_9ARAC|nr:hypothetical protein CDAR_616241 [Caerostris darwini]
MSFCLTAVPTSTRVGSGRGYEHYGTEAIGQERRHHPCMWADVGGHTEPALQRGVLRPQRGQDSQKKQSCPGSLPELDRRRSVLPRPQRGRVPICSGPACHAPTLQTVSGRSGRRVLQKGLLPQHPTLLLQASRVRPTTQNHPGLTNGLDPGL